MDIWNLIAKKFADRLTSEEAERLSQWLEADESHRIQFKQAEYLWKLKNKSIDVDVQQDWNNLSDRLGLSQLKEEEKTPNTDYKVLKKEPNTFVPNSLNRWYYGLAAVIIMLVGIGYWIIGTTSNKLIHTNTDNEVRMVNLPDGSKVWLNAGTSLTYPATFNKELRSLTLDGEAYFEVVRNEKAPFTIYSGDAYVKVLGTSFQMKAYIDSAQVIVNVSSGKVALGNERQTVELSASRRGKYDRKSGTLEKEGAFDENTLAWKTRRLVFNATPLSEVAGHMETYFMVDISISPEEMSQCLYTGTFEEPSLTEMLTVIGATFNLEIKQEGKKVMWMGKSCQPSN